SEKRKRRSRESASAWVARGFLGLLGRHAAHAAHALVTDGLSGRLVADEEAEVVDPNVVIVPVRDAEFDRVELIEIEGEALSTPAFRKQLVELEGEELPAVGELEVRARGVVTSVVVRTVPTL